ncbi:hypothetical protein SOHN41_01213 [Shewanella sp. HN-41]|nr:hypothetical protein SOHN41_01213 [Shewanella sp. HN-41]
MIIRNLFMGSYINETILQITHSTRYSRAEAKVEVEVELNAH